MLIVFQVLLPQVIFEKIIGVYIRSMKGFCNTSISTKLCQNLKICVTFFEQYKTNLNF